MRARSAPSGPRQAPGSLLPFPDDLPSSIRAKIVEKCGDRGYWSDWANEVGKIAQAQISRIKALVDERDIRKQFDAFVQELKDALNDSVTKDDAIEMLAQHAVTGPVFDALFGEDGFMDRNPVGRAMQRMWRLFDDKNLESENQNLQRFYDNVRRRVEGAKSANAQQWIIAELYDKFFRLAFPSTTQKLGIVYTPVELVDFLLQSVQDVLLSQFNTGFGSKASMCWTHLPAQVRSSRAFCSRT